MKVRNQFGAMVATFAAASVWALFTQPASAQDPVVFTDNFSSGSTLNEASIPGGTPTASSTSYDIVGNKGTTSAGSSISANDLNLSLSASSSGYVEAQAIFTDTPLVLVNTGDYVDFTFEFKDTANMGNTNGPNTLWIGLFNSGGVLPFTNLQNVAGGTNEAGGVQDWTGYSSQLFAAGSTSSKLIYRAAQGLAVGNQDLLGNDVAAGTYDDPKGVQLMNASTTSTLELTNGNLYTEDFRITLTAANQLTVTNTVYAGSGTGGTILFAQGGLSNNVPNTTFDSLAFGWINKDSLVSTEDVSFVQITSNIPEPSTLALLGTGLALMIGSIRRRR